MLIGQSQDWPLSREEKKSRLLRLYDQDLEEAGRMLQRISPSGGEGTGNSKGDLLSAECSKENFGDSFNTGSVAIPGVIDDDSSSSSLYSHGKKPPRLEDTPGSSARSFEYMTPEPTPRTPPGYHSSLGHRAVAHVQRPVSAPTAPSGLPRPLVGKDFSVCKRTGTMIPSIPPMPSAALRSDSAANASAGTACLTPPPCQGDAADLACHAAPSLLACHELPPPLPMMPKRPHSAAAASSSSGRRHSSRDVSCRRSEASVKEICFPPNVFSAARHGRYTEVESAFLAGFVPNFADSYGNTVFHIACQNGQRRIAKLAVKYGCDMNAQNMRGNTGLHFLFAYGYPEIAEYFIKKGADELVGNGLGKMAREGIK